MKLIYTPEGDAVQEFQLFPFKLINVEAEMLEEVGGETWETYYECGQKLLSGNVKARRAFLWMCLRRSNPELRFRDVAFHLDEVRVELEDNDLESAPVAPGKDETADNVTNGG